MPPPTKQKAILENAAQLFMTRGFRGVSMDLIAATTPVSKPTLYAHFKNKRDLFAAVVANRCQALIESFEDTLKSNMDTRAALETLGDKFLDMVLHKDSIYMHRIIMAEVQQFPEMARMLYESGPIQSLSFMTNYFQKLAKAGQLKIDDAAKAAELFLSMLKGHMYTQCSLGIQEDVPATQRHYHARSVVEVFMRAYAA